MRAKYLVSLLLLVGTILVFWQAGSHGFINFDDNEYIYENPYLKLGLTPAGIRWAFTTFHASNWHPLTWLSHMADLRFYGMNPFGHHITSVFLHGTNVVLLFWLFFRLTGLLGRSAVVAALFALHPQHVESVAWVAERKDVLCAFFWLATLLCYVEYVKRSGRRFYLLALVMFACALMAKPMAVTLPIVLLLLDYWPLCRWSTGETSPENCSREAGIAWGRLVLEKIPFLVLSGASCVLTLLAQQQGGAVDTLANSPITMRVANAVIAYGGYLFKMFWPRNLAIFYPLPKEIPLTQLLAAAVVCAAATALAIHLRRSKPFITFGWLWYVVTLLPVIGLVQVGGQASADRYTYLPLIGIFILLVWSAGEFTEKLPRRRIVLAFASVAVLVCCTLVTLRQLSYWQDNDTLYTHALEVTDDNYLAHNNLGFALEREDKLSEATAHFNEAVRISPGFAHAWINLGETFANTGDLDKSVVCLSKAIDLRPDYATAYLDLGVAMFREKRSAAALSDFDRALALDPMLADGYYNKGIVLSMEGRSDEAIAAFANALKINPDNSDYLAKMNSELARKRVPR